MDLSQAVQRAWDGLVDPMGELARGICERPDEHGRAIYVTAVLDAHRRDQLVVRLRLPAYRGICQRIEGEDIVMRLSRSRRAWTPVPYRAKVIFPLGSLRQGRGVERRRAPRNVVHDPVMESARDGRIIIYNGEGVASGWVRSEPSCAARPRERRWDVAAGRAT